MKSGTTAMHIWSEINSRRVDLGGRHLIRSQFNVVMFRFFICHVTDFTPGLFEEEENRHVLFLEIYQEFDNVVFQCCNVELKRKIEFITVGNEICVTISSSYTNKFNYSFQFVTALRTFLQKISDNGFSPRQINVLDDFFSNSMSSLSIQSSDSVFLSNPFESC